MAKDPALLWYWGDWNSGTATFTRHLKGCYIDLLHAQFNSGPLSVEEIKIVLGADFAAWGTLQKKFKRTETGLFFNERLELEKNKRKSFSESRRKNVQKRYDKSTSVDTSVEHMNLHMENENENENTIDSKEGLLGENLKFSFDYTTKIPAMALEAAEQNQFTKTKRKNTDFVLSQWKVFLYERMADPPIKLKEYRQIGDLTRYFLNWMREKYPKNGTNQQLTGKRNKSAGADELLEQLEADARAMGGGYTGR
ncbi:hypothetical protein ACX0G7_09830 [Flavitalea antarctica]